VSIRAPSSALLRRRSFSRGFVIPLLAALLATGVSAAASPALAQVAAADSASVLLEAARGFEAEGRWDVAEALYRLIAERYGTTAAATEARARLAAPPRDVVDGSGSVELRVWMTLYGAWLGVAVPGAFGADSSEPYGVGLLVGGPAGFLGGRALARSLDLTEGQARAITFGGTWGTWQGLGWQEVLDLGVAQDCSFGPDLCYDAEGTSEEVFAAMIVGGLTGIAAGTLLSRRDVTAGTGSAVNFASLWGTWFGVAGGTLLDLEDDGLLAATLVGGNVALVSAALLAPRWNVSRGRARLVSIAGVLGGLAGAGVDLLAKPDGDHALIGIPLAGSILGLGIGIAATRGRDGGTAQRLEAGRDGALFQYHRGTLSLGAPTPLPTLVPAGGQTRNAWRPALRFELFRADF
jgi:hypothetical protein